MRFAPAAAARVRSEERKITRAWKRRADRGYPEYAAMILGASSARIASKRARQEMMRRLDGTRGKRTFTLTKKGLAALLKAVTGSRPGASRRSA
jgi:hypothetical protein